MSTCVTPQFVVCETNKSDGPVVGSAVFLASVELSEDEFAQRCQQAIRSDPKAEQYLEIVIASMDYDAFYNLMKSMRSRASLDRLQADAKARGDSDDNDGEKGDDDPKGTKTGPVGSSAASKRSRDDDDDDDVGVKSDCKDSHETGLAVRGLGIQDDDAKKEVE